jgi:hypothetical protein
MLGTNRDLEFMRRRLAEQIGRLEFLLARGCYDPAAVAKKLGRMRTHQQTIDTTLINRRIEASKPVVDFFRWLDGNGAVYDLPDLIESFVPPSDGGGTPSQAG